MIYFKLNDLEFGKQYNFTQKRLKLGKVSSFDTYNMCAKVERITAKTGYTSCTNWTISFKVQGFQTKTHYECEILYEISDSYKLTLP